MDISQAIWSFSLLLVILTGGVILLWYLNHSQKPWTRCAHSKTDPLPQDGYRRCRRCGTLLDKDGKEIAVQRLVQIAQSINPAK